MLLTAYLLLISLFVNSTPFRITLTNYKPVVYRQVSKYRIQICNLSTFIYCYADRSGTYSTLVLIIQSIEVGLTLL